MFCGTETTIPRFTRNLICTFLIILLLPTFIKWVVGQHSLFQVVADRTDDIHKLATVKLA